MQVRITGTGKFLPGEPVPNSFVVETANLGPKCTVEWMENKIGIKTRYMSRPRNATHGVSPLKGLANSDLAANAGERALKDAGVDKSEVDLLIVATCTPDYPIPAMSTIVQEKLGINNLPAIDIRAACSGFTQAVLIAQQFLKTGAKKTVLVIGSEVTSTQANLNADGPNFTKSDQVNTCMMGDGASAFVLQAFTQEQVDKKLAYGHEVLYVTFSSCGSGQSPGIYVPCGGSLIPFSQQAIDKGLHWHQQDFRRILSHGPELYIKAINESLSYLNCTITDVDIIVPHQANGKIPLIGKSLGFNSDKIFMNFAKYGNTANASLPLCIDDLAEEDTLPDGSLVLAIAAESTKWLYGAICIRWHPKNADSGKRKQLHKVGFFGRVYSNVCWSLLTNLAKVKNWFGW